MVNGLRTTAGPLPLRVFLTSRRGPALRVGRIEALDTGGNAIVYRPYDVDLSRYKGIEVRDKTGAVVLQGSVALRPSITTPSP